LLLQVWVRMPHLLLPSASGQTASGHYL